MISSVNSACNTIAFGRKKNKISEPKQTPYIQIKNIDNDIFEPFHFPSEVQIKPQTQQQPPKIGFFRILFNRLTKEQIKAVNECRELPKNAKFKSALGEVGITWNIWDVTTGTHKLPAGYELKRDILGFTHVVREGTKSLFIR